MFSPQRIDKSITESGRFASFTPPYFFPFYFHHQRIAGTFILSRRMRVHINQHHILN